MNRRAANAAVALLAWATADYTVRTRGVLFTGRQWAALVAEHG